LSSKPALEIHVTRESFMPICTFMGYVYEQKDNGQTERQTDKTAASGHEVS